MEKTFQTNVQAGSRIIDEKGKTLAVVDIYTLIFTGKEEDRIVHEVFTTFNHYN